MNIFDNSLSQTAKILFVGSGDETAKKFARGKQCKNAYYTHTLIVDETEEAAAAAITEKAGTKTMIRRWRTDGDCRGGCSRDGGGGNGDGGGGIITIVITTRAAKNTVI